MNALCPDCKGAGCDKCKDGYREVGFAKGILYTRACTYADCKYENGGYIVEPTAKKGPNGEPPEPSGECILCRKPTRWKRLGDMDEFIDDFKKEVGD